MLIRQHLTETLQQLIHEALPEARDIPIEIESPKQSDHGDFACNFAMRATKLLQRPPRELAEQLVELIHEHTDWTAEAAGPGFVNIRLPISLWQAQLPILLQAKDILEAARYGDGEQVNVEYVSANPTGPLHIGHARGTVVGQVIANVLEATGFNVTREYVVNDAGGQVGVLGRSVYQRYLEALGHDIGEIPNGLYPGDYLKPIGQALADQHGDAFVGKEESEWLELFKRFAIDAMMSSIKHDLQLLGVTHDVFFSEQSLQDDGRIDHGIETLDKLGLLYTGKLEKPKSSNLSDDDYAAEDLLLFKSTEFGDDVDRAMRKTNGEHTYLAGDFAYHLNKFERGATQMIVVLGADHAGHVKPLTAGVKAITENKANLTIKLCQMVNFMQGDEPAKMSKRAGTYETINDLVEAVGKDVVFFTFATKDPNSQFTFDLEVLTAQSMENPVFYVQYAHARTCSVLNNAKTQHIEFSDYTAKTLAHLTHDTEIALIKKLTAYPEAVQRAARKLGPNILTDYLHGLSSQLHSWWVQGQRDSALRFITDDAELSKARLVLVRAIQRVLAEGLTLCNVTPKDKMEHQENDADAA